MSNSLFSLPESKPQRTTNPNDFTERSNWSQCLIEGLQDFLHVLSADGIVVYASRSCENVTGYQPSQLLGRLIGDFIHPDDLPVFVEDFQDAISNANSFRIIYRMRTADNRWAIFESQCRPFARDAFFQNDFQRNAKIVEVIVMARPYSSPNGALLDSFLHHTMEYERLTRRLVELRREAVESEEEILRIDKTLSPGPSVSTMIAPATPFQSKDPAMQSHGPTFSEQSGPSPNVQLESIEDYDTADTEDPNYTIMGDLGIPFSKNRTIRKPSTRRAKRAIKIPHPCACMACGVPESPEWRKGPQGPKTLCNACGLRWSKQSKAAEPSGMK